MTNHIYNTAKSEYDVSFIGPPLEEGPLPAVFYFALSDKDSLLLDPFNQPTLPFIDSSIRVFSITIPGHEYPLKKEDAITFWQESIEQGKDLLSPFFEQTCNVIKELFEKNYITKLGVMGLSRGGFIALHIAARVPQISSIALFAPMLSIHKIEELKNLPDSFLNRYALEPHLGTLSERNMTLFIGNADTRVDTKSTLTFFEALCRHAQEKEIRYPPITLNVTQSMGYKGHGTSKETFIKGAEWLKNSLLRK